MASTVRNRCSFILYQELRKQKSSFSYRIPSTYSKSTSKFLGPVPEVLDNKCYPDFELGVIFIFVNVSSALLLF